MICLRCGYCCKHLLVPVVDDPEKGIQDGNIIVYKGNGTPCKHLKGDKVGSYKCAIHHYSWFKDTPCADYGQIETGNTQCRTGKHIMRGENK